MLLYNTNPNGSDPKATEHLEELKQHSKNSNDLLGQLPELLAEQTENIKKLVEVSNQTANSTAELAKATEGNDKKSNIALGTAIISTLIALATLIVDYLGNAQWQRDQIHLLEQQNELLESISEQLASVKNSDPVTSSDIEAINNKLDQFIQLPEPE